MGPGAKRPFELDGSMSRILVVDDEAAIRTLLRRKLEGTGHEVTEAENGAEAIALLRTTGFDLVLTDILMPERDGLEVLMFLQREQPDLPCVVLSSPSNHVYLESGRLMGAVDVLQKPFTLEQVAEVVARVLG
jgi:two-component system response regulator (stage 0 sporulation protein F)